MLENKKDYYNFASYQGRESMFDYTLNKHIYDLDEISDNMVILFSEGPGWNQVGDYESIKDVDRVKVFLRNGKSHLFRKNQVQHLRWRPEDSGVIPKPDVKFPVSVFTAAILIITFCILLRCKDSMHIVWLLALGMGIASAVAGALLGAMAEEVYYKLNALAGLIAPWVSAVWCFLIGVTFIAVIGSIYKKYNTKVSMPGYAIVFGAITGIIASCIVHGYMMIAYQETSFKYMLAGSSFAIIAGLILGWITSGLIKLYKNNTAIKASKIAPN